MAQQETGRTAHPCGPTVRLPIAPCSQQRAHCVKSCNLQPTSSTYLLIERLLLLARRDLAFLLAWTAHQTQEVLALGTPTPGNTALHGGPRPPLTTIALPHRRTGTNQPTNNETNTQRRNDTILARSNTCCYIR